MDLDAHVDHVQYFSSRQCVMQVLSVHRHPPGSQGVWSSCRLPPRSSTGSWVTSTRQQNQEAPPEQQQVPEDQEPEQASTSNAVVAGESLCQGPGDRVQMHLQGPIQEQRAGPKGSSAGSGSTPTQAPTGACACAEACPCTSWPR